MCISISHNKILKLALGETNCMSSLGEHHDIELQNACQEINNIDSATTSEQ